VFSPAIARSLFTDQLTEAAAEAFETAAAGGAFVSLPPKIASPIATKIALPTAGASTAAATATTAAAATSVATPVPSFLTGTPPAPVVTTIRPFPLTDAELTLLKTAPTEKEMTPGTYINKTYMDL